MRGIAANPKQLLRVLYCYTLMNITHENKENMTIFRKQLQKLKVTKSKEILNKAVQP